MSKATLLATVLMVAVGFVNIGVAQTAAAGDHGVTVTVKGESWDACSRGFAFYMKLSKKERAQTSARRGSRVSVDGQPDIFAITDPGFELTFTTAEPTFRLIVRNPASRARQSRALVFGWRRCYRPTSPRAWCSQAR